MIYGAPADGDAIDQGDILDDCPILTIGEFDPEDVRPPSVIISPNRVLAITQTCDLANGKVSAANVAVVLNARQIVEAGLLKAADVRGPIRAGRVWGWYFLPASAAHGLEEMIVDLRQLHTVRLDLLTGLANRGRRRARLQSPYREHLAKHFADTFSRIGLPEPYETE